MVRRGYRPPTAAADAGFIREFLPPASKVNDPEPVAPGRTSLVGVDLVASGPFRP